MDKKEVVCTSCDQEPEEDITSLGHGPIDFSQFSDNYAAISSPDFSDQWAHYNVHDPSILDARDYLDDADDFFYCYNTDVAYGNEVKPGIQIRRSINLVEWEFVGWVFTALPGSTSSYIISGGGTPNNGLWAPYIMQVGDEFRCYYSHASDIGRLSAIGLAVSDNPKGPFADRGIVVKSTPGVGTNAIDPTVIIGEDGKHWMYYGSSWDAIYKIELDPSSGLAANPAEIGIRVAHRGFTDGWINGNIEGPEIIFNPDFNKYYLFISYDWLETKYNVRVGRSDNPDGPFYDVFGNDMNQLEDNWPMILAPYRFQNHSGWQGVSHPAVFARDNDFFIGHQGRPGDNPYFMILHTRQIHWTDEGWPMISPQRYAGESESTVTKEELVGSWEYIYFDYRVVPGFADTQTSADFQSSRLVTLHEDGTMGDNPSDQWNYESPWLTLEWKDAERNDKVRVERGRDWENQVDETLLFTGFDEDYFTIWGKKID
jgi:arabinan endo-1,5-alpha-L-arabinosidase